MHKCIQLLQQCVNREFNLIKREDDELTVKCPGNSLSFLQKVNKQHMVGRQKTCVRGKLACNDSRGGGNLYSSEMLAKPPFSISRIKSNKRIVVVCHHF